MVLEQARERHVHGRRRGKRLTARRQRLVDELLPSLVLPAGASRLDARALFGDTRPLWLEIGFGGGEHLAWQAAQHTEVGLIGSEVFLKGIATALRALEAEGAKNVRLWPDDARMLLERLAPASLDRVFILFPDPWPKARHHKRRLVNDQSLDRLAELLKPGGELRLATDDEDYLVWMLEHLWRHRADFRWTAERAQDWRSRDWPETRYEAKARAAGRPSTYLSYRRRD
jgi:tRNA (guanine-N7-)-methyltransferase